MAVEMLDGDAKVAYFDSGVDEPGFYELGGEPTVDDSGEHHTEMTPETRVYPHEGWFSYEDAKDGDS